MGNILTKIKRFLSNKNTVTIICVFAGILVLYIGYNWRVSDATSPTSVPYAKTTLTSGHVITADDIGYIDVSGTVLSKSRNLVRNRNSIIGKKVAYGETIQTNSFFFPDDLVDANSSTGNVFEDIDKGTTGVFVPVNIHTTFGNAIYPGNYIDLWFEGKDENGKFMYGKFIRSIRVLDVTDKSGKSVFETGAESREPSELLFAVSDELYKLIDAARDIGEVVPVPRNLSYSQNPGATEIASSYIQNYILTKVAVIPDESINNNTTTNRTEE